LRTRPCPGRDNCCFPIPRSFGSQARNSRWRGVWRAQKEPDVVFITAPPFSQFLLAPWPVWPRGTAVVLDYRDEWSTLRQTTRWWRAVLARVVGEGSGREAASLRACGDHGNRGLSPKSTKAFPFPAAERVFAIPNGYDREDIPASLPAPTGDRWWSPTRDHIR